jgi:hypothetical protein
MKITHCLKHRMSCLSDQSIALDLDHDAREVRLSMDAFDSALVVDVVTRILPADHQVLAYRDDARKDAAWRTEAAPYRLRIDIASVRYRAQVMRLSRHADVTVAVSLEPLPPDEEARDRQMRAVEGMEEDARRQGLDDGATRAAIAEHLAPHGGIDMAFCYRSHLLLVGRSTTSELRVLEQTLGEILGHAVDVVLYEPEEWANLQETHPAWAAIVSDAAEVVRVFQRTMTLGTPKAGNASAE